MITNNMREKKSQRTESLIVFFSIFNDILGFSFIMLILPYIGQEYQVSNFLLGLLLSSNALIGLFLGPIWGKLSDKYGRKPTLIACQAGTMCAFLLLALSSSIEMILISRLVDGFFGGQIPILRAYIADTTRDDEKARTVKMGRLTAYMLIGSLVGPLIGGILGTWNWRYSPLLIVGLYVVIIPSSFSYFKESLPKLVAQEVKEPSGAIKASLLTKRVIILLGVFFFVFLVHTMLSSSLSLMIYARFTQSSLAIGSLNIFSGISLMIFSVVLIKPITKRVAEQKIVVISIGMLIGFFLAYPFVTEFWMLFVLFIPFECRIDK